MLGNYPCGNRINCVQPAPRATSTASVISSSLAIPVDIIMGALFCHIANEGRSMFSNKQSYMLAHLVFQEINRALIERCRKNCNTKFCMREHRRCHSRERLSPSVKTYSLKPSRYPLLIMTSPRSQSIVIVLAVYVCNLITSALA